MTGVRLTQSALTQDALKQAAGPLGAAYQRLRENIGKAEVVHTDDTGWRVGGRTAFLMVFATQTETVYQIRERHRNEEVREVISTEICGEFGQNLKQPLRQALRLIEERALLPPAEYQQQVGELDAQLTHHLRNRILRDDDNQRLLNSVGTQQDRGNLLRFLKTIPGSSPASKRSSPERSPPVRRTNGGRSRRRGVRQRTGDGEENLRH
jgi:hypothetical protein